MPSELRNMFTVEVETVKGQDTDMAIGEALDEQEQDFTFVNSKLTFDTCPIYLKSDQKVLNSDVGFDNLILGSGLHFESSFGTLVPINPTTGDPLRGRNFELQKVFSVDGNLSPNTPGSQETADTCLEAAQKENRPGLKKLALKDILIVLSGFIMQMFPHGLGNSYGVVYGELKTMEQYSDYQLSWIGSIMSGMMGPGAIVGSILVEGAGCRLTTVAGALLIAIGMVISAMFTNIYVLYVALGALPGIGAAFCQLAAIVTLSKHFQKGRSLAVGIVASGGAVGMVSFPLLWTFLFETIGWQYALLAVGGVSLNIVWCSVFLKPSSDETNDGKCAEGEVKVKTPMRKLGEYAQYFRSSTFLVYQLAITFSGTPLFIFGSYVPEFAKSEMENVSSTQLAVSVSAMGAGSFGGRILFGSLSMLSARAPLLLFTVGLALCGVTDLLVPLCRSYILLVSNSTLHGLLMGGVTSIIPLVTMTLCGVDGLPKTLGITFLFQGLGSLAGPPLANVLVNMTQELVTLFYFAGASYAASSFLIGFLCRKKGHAFDSVSHDMVVKRRQSRSTSNSFVVGG